MNQLSSQFIPAIVSGVVLATSSGCSPEPASAQQRPLRVAVNQDSPPLSYRSDDGSLIGFHVDMAKLMCELMQMPCAIEESSTSQIVDQVSSGEFDVAVVGLMVTPERASRVLFSSPYRSGKSYWVSRVSLDNARNVTVAAKDGSLQLQWAQHRGKNVQWRTLPVETTASIEVALRSGKADAAISPPSYTLELIKKGDLARDGFKFTVIEDEGLSSPAAIAVTPSNPQLRDRIDAALQEIKINGQMSHIGSKYFPGQVF